MEDEGGDVAQLMPPVAVTANGVLKIISTYRTGTTEVQQFLSSECNIIFECKKCQSLYRSIANFISHKRNYCKKDTDPSESTLQNGPTAEAYAKIETINASLQRKDIDHIADRLCEKAAKVCSDGVIGENKEATERVQYFTSLAEAVKERRAARREQIISLTPIPGTSKAVAVSVSPKKVPSSPPKCAPPSTSASSTTSSVETSVEDPSVEDKKKSRGRPRKISLDQKNSKPAVSSENATSSPTTSTDCGPTMLDKTAPNYCCEKCHAQFTSQKSLNLHETTQHMTTRMQYKCPCCKNSFCNLWSTYRHLKSIHRKTQEQVERMKPVIRKRAFKMTVPVYRPLTSTSSSPQSSRASSPAPQAASPTIVPKPKPAAKSLLVKTTQQELDKAWVGMDNNFTVDVGDHRCGVCGLRFERRAALISHTNTCHRKPTSTSANKSSSAKSPRAGSPCVDPAPVVEKVKPEGAANRKSSTPIRIIRGPRPSEIKPDTSTTNKTPVKTPEKINNPPIKTTEISPTSVKENEISRTTLKNNVPNIKLNTETTIKRPIKNEDIITNGFQKSSGKKIPLKIPQSMNPVVKLVYANKGLMKQFPQQRRASPNIIKKSTAKVYSSHLANKKLAETIKDNINSKSTLVNNVTTKLLEENKNVASSTTIQSTIINGTQGKFIRLTPVASNNKNNIGNRVNIKTILPFTVKNSVKSLNSSKVSTNTSTITTSSPIKTESPQKAEIIVRTVSDKTTIINNNSNNSGSNNSKTILQTSPNIIKNVLNLTELSPEKSDINKIDLIDDKSRSSTSSSIDKTPEKGKSGIQIRRDYGKISLTESETSCSSRPGSVSAGSEDEEFSGWDANIEDDFQRQLGLPQINNMNHVYQMISVDNDTPYTSESENRHSPSHTTSNNIEPSPVKTRGMRESEAKKRKIDS